MPSPDSGGEPRARDRTTLLIVAAIAAVCASGALRSTDAWAAFFAHPLVDSDITRHGAVLWRIMLAVFAAALVGGTFTLTRLHCAALPSVLVTDAGSRRLPVYGMLGLIVLALLIRSTRITESLWYDEIASWRTYNGGTQGWGAVIGAFLDPINHTLHTLLNRLTVQWFAGEVVIEIAFRLPALVFSLAVVPVMFGLGRAAANERVGWFAAFVAAVAPVCVLEGVEARGYSMMIFFSAASTWTLIEAYRRGSPLLWLLYALCCALGVWSQFVTAWIAIGHGAWLSWRFWRHDSDRTRCTQGFIAIALAGLASIMLHAPMIPGLLAWRENFVAARPDQPRILGAEGLHALMQLGGAWAWWAAIIGLALLIVGMASARKRAAELRASITPGEVISLSLLGMSLMLLAVAISGTWLYARFMLFAVPGALLAMAIGLDALWTRRAWLGYAGIALFACAAGADLATRPPKQPLREAVEFVRQSAQDGDGVLAVGLAHDVLSIYDMELNIEDSFMFGRDLQAKLDAIQPRWVIVEYPLHVPRDRYALLESRGYREVARFEGWADWGHGDVLVYSNSIVR